MPCHCCSQAKLDHVDELYNFETSKNLLSSLSTRLPPEHKIRLEFCAGDVTSTVGVVLNINITNLISKPLSGLFDGADASAVDAQMTQIEHALRALISDEEVAQQHHKSRGKAKGRWMRARAHTLDKVRDVMASVTRYPRMYSRVLGTPGTSGYCLP